MALVLKDRVQEQTAVTGDSPAVLLGEIAGYQSFANSTPNASVVYYTIAGGTEWEVGYGTYYTNNNSVVRVTSQVYSSSNAGSIVNFSAGTKNIFVTLPAEQSVYQETDGSLKLIGGIIEVSLDGTESGNALPNVAFQAFSTIPSYMQSNMQNLDSSNTSSADWVVTADTGTDTNNYIDLGMGSSGYNYPEYSGTGPLDGYLMNTGRNLVLLSGKYGANVAGGNSSSSDIVFVAGDLLAGGERGRVKGSTGNFILSNESNPSDAGEKLQVTGNVTANNITLSGAAYASGNITTSTQLTTKSYVDQAVSTGFVVHTPVRVVANTYTGNNSTYSNGANGVGATITSTNNVALSIDGVNVAVNDRILFRALSNAAWNGAYYVVQTGNATATWQVERATDFDEAIPGEIANNAYFYVSAGTTYKGYSYVLSQLNAITVGTTALPFTEFASSLVYVGGTNINVSGQTISLDGTVGVTNGGTGINTVSTGDLIYANAGNSLTNLTIGTSGQTIISSGGTPSWGALDMAGAGVSGTLPANHGGTGFASYTVGDMVYANTTTSLAKVSPNQTTTKKILSQTGDGATAGTPAWDTISSGDVSGLGTMALQNATSVAITGGAINGTLIGNATPSSGSFTTLVASSNVSGTGFANYLNSPPSIGGVTPNTGAFTNLQGTNVTALTGFIGNGASLSNLNASNISSGVVSVSYGGTGLSNVGASGNVLTSNGTDWVSSAPATGALAAGNSSIIINNVNITSNATIAAGQNGFSVGPVNTANGVVVTVSAGQSWVVI